MKRVLRVGVIVLLALALVGNAALGVGAYVTREPAARPLTGSRIVTASRPAIVLIQSNYSLSASLPSMDMPQSKYDELVAQVQAMYRSGEISTLAQAEHAAEFDRMVIDFLTH